jgi:hypothetical protein
MLEPHLLDDVALRALGLEDFGTLRARKSHGTVNKRRK